MKTLKCVGRYINSARQLVFEPGQVFEAEPELERFLMADAPGCFEAGGETKAMKAPPADKMLKAEATK